MTISVTPIPRLISLGPPAYTLGTSNVAGSAVTTIASDSTLLVYDATVPTTIAYPSAVSASTGSASVSARRDHTHGIAAGLDNVAPTTIAYGASAAAGSSSISARRDHTHGMVAAPASDTARVVAGSYTGDGSTSQAITGVGFTVKHIMIFQMSDVDDGLSGDRAVSWTNTTQIAGNAAGQAVTLDNGSGRGLNIQDAIIALGSDGFTVDDQGADSHPNKNGQVYTFTCWGY